MSYVGTEMSSEVIGDLVGENGIKVAERGGVSKASLTLTEGLKVKP